MRKWMRDRLKRRKKSEDKGPEPKPAPLQPAYFDSGTPVPAAIEKPAPVEKQEQEPDTRKPQRAGHSHSAAVQATPLEKASEREGERRRRRRGRGGRSRGRATGEGTQTSPPSQIPERALAASVLPPEKDTVTARELIPAATPEPSSAKETPAVTPRRASKGVVVLAIGLPGSGKSSWFKRHNIRPLSSDLLRELLFDDPTEQRFQDLVFSNLRSMLKARLLARKPLNYVDATNLTAHDRRSWIKLAKDFGYDVQAVFFDVPLEVCLERNLRRRRVVAEDVMRRMASKLHPPAFEEGFTKITVVRVKKKD